MTQAENPELGQEIRQRLSSVNTDGGMGHPAVEFVLRYSSPEEAELHKTSLVARLQADLIRNLGPGYQKNVPEDPFHAQTYVVTPEGLDHTLLTVYFILPYDSSMQNCRSAAAAVRNEYDPRSHLSDKHIPAAALAS
jgi:hypothetical protein